MCKRADPITVNPMEFTPYVEYEVIRNAVSHKLYTSLGNPPKRFGETQQKLKLQRYPYKLVTL